VRRSSRRLWWPASTTFGWIWIVVPPMSVDIASSSTSKPSALSRRIRSSTRQRSPVSNRSTPVSSDHSSR
jgi:hypothetical protein